MACQTEFGLSWETTEGSHCVVTAAEHQSIRKFDFAVVIFIRFKLERLCMKNISGNFLFLAYTGTNEKDGVGWKINRLCE